MTKKTDMNKQLKIDAITSAMRGEVVKLRQLIHGGKIAVYFQKPTGETDFVMYDHKRYSAREWDIHQARMMLSGSDKINFNEAK